VITVWGPVGSPGRSTVAAGIAAELCAAGHSVILADADSYAASQAIALGLLDEAPGFAAACRLAGVDGLSRSELDRIGQRVRIGGAQHWVLTGISRANRWPELSADRVTDVLAACRDWVDYTIVDIAGVIESDEEISSDLLAPRRNAAAVAALRAADVVVAVGRADPVGVSRFLRGYADLQEIVQTRRVRVVMNGVRSTAVGAGATAQLARTLLRFGGILDCDFLPHDQGAVDASVLEGRPLMVVAPKSPLRRAIGELVDRHLLPRQSARRVPGRRRPRRRALQTAG
jgi:MinD-like ATPase involved in chromosome partitioning or flagellar assembly